jgi:uncharacterized zinc-type alcohol dehydrogenase-like protein
MSTARAFAATSATDPVSTLEIERRDVGPHDVLIDITYCGICHSDIHHSRGEWGEATYPVVPGHEIAGVVATVGDDVTKFSVGDRVGVGCMVDSCGECVSCKAGDEQYCLAGSRLTYGSDDPHGGITQGGYSSQIVVTEDFVLKIPDGIELDVAAPLLCAGITTYSPLRHWGAAPGKKVGVIGFGGLGHMAVKLAHAMGAEVYVLSRSLSKQEDGERFGADHYHATSDPETFTQLEGRLDLIINTVSAKLNLDQFLGLLGRDGALVNVGIPPEAMSFNAFSLLRGRKSFAGSLIGGIRETQEMLDFCAEHGIWAEIELIGADKINDAWERVVNSDVRYRFVIDTATI